jgi:hypothetical protein
MRTFVNSRAMIMTLALQNMDDQALAARRRTRRRVRRTGGTSASERSG